MLTLLFSLFTTQYILIYIKNKSIKYAVYIYCVGYIMVNNRRSEFDIISKILSLSKGGAKKTEILYKGNLSYTQVQKYLPYLIEKKIIEECTVKNNGGSCKIYKITEKGSILLNDIQKILVYFD